LREVTGRRKRGQAKAVELQEKTGYDRYSYLAPRDHQESFPLILFSSSPPASDNEYYVK